MAIVHCHYVNLQRGFLGGEVFTLFFTRAMVALGCPVTLYVSADNKDWRRLSLQGVTLVALRGPDELPESLPRSRSLVVTGGPVPPSLLAAVAKRHFLAGFAHMPMYDRSPEGFAHHHLIFGVSEHVNRSLRQHGLGNVYPEPFYGVADFDRFGVRPGKILSRSPYIWDRRKLRDVLLGVVEPLFLATKHAREFERRQGITLGIVSGIGPIKQFPLLFRHIAPRIAVHRQVSLEVFGSGGYAQVRDLMRELAPLGNRARFWGMQDSPQRIYPCLDYLLSGLPEKEALGLNIIEAQVCGTPVLAVDAPPFTETVMNGLTGFLYRDPRGDGGEDFGRVFDRILSGPRLDPHKAQEHLSRFSSSAFRLRVARMTDYVSSRMGREQ